MELGTEVKVNGPTDLLSVNQLIARYQTANHQPGSDSDDVRLWSLPWRPNATESRLIDELSWIESVPLGGNEDAEKGSLVAVPTVPAVPAYLGV